MLMLWLSAVLSAIASFAASVAAGVFLTAEIPLIGSFVSLERTFNKGVAFGILLPEPIQIALILTAVLLVSIYAVKEASTTLSRMGFGMILGGGIANVFDRFSDGMVTDFIRIGSFPVFNIADSFITVGVFLLFWEMVIRRGSAVPSRDGNPKTQIPKHKKIPNSKIQNSNGL